MLNKIMVLAAALSLGGCAVSPIYSFEGPEREQLMDQVLGDQPPQTELVTLRLAEDIQRALEQRINPRWRNKRKLRELRQFLFSDEELGVSYDAKSTLTATETFRARQGNCLAMTNLFIAAGRHVGIDANYQTVSVKPTWDHAGETMIRYEHIVAVGDLGEENYVVDFLPDFLIGDRPTEQISDEKALALYYNNLGAEAVVEGRPERGVDYLRKALALDPKNSDAWNNMGAAKRRAGKYELAEFAYVQSLEHDAYNYSALSNLSRHYESEGRTQEAENLSARVDRYRRRNPYFHYFVGQVFYEEGRLEDAEFYFNNAIRLKRDEPEFYEAAARVYAALGYEQDRIKQLDRARYFRERKITRPPERIMNSRLMVRKNM